MIDNQIKDLAALVAFPIVSIAEDLARLTQMIEELRGLMPFDKEHVDQLFSNTFGSVPCTQSALDSWLSEVHPLVNQAHHAAILAQTLIRDIFELINCITGIIEQVLQVVGSVQGLQTLGQIQSVTFHQQARMTAMIGAFQSAMSLQGVARLTRDHADVCIAKSRLRDIPRENPYGLQLGSP